jgi:hypothetical protein
MKISIILLLIGLSFNCFAKNEVDCDETSISVRFEFGLPPELKVCAFGKSDLYYFRDCTNKPTMAVQRFKNDKEISFGIEKESVSFTEKPIRSVQNKLLTVDLASCSIKDDKTKKAIESNLKKK